MTHSWWNPRSLICLILWHIQHCTLFKWYGTHLAVCPQILRPCRKIWSTVHPEILVCLADPSQSRHLSSFLHSSVMATESLCGWTLFSWSFHVWMHVLTLNLLITVRHSHPVLCAALLGALCCISLVQNFVFTYESCWSLRTCICKWDHWCGNAGAGNGCAVL